MEQNTREILKGIQTIMEDKKAEKIVLLDIRQVSVLSDFFIIAEGKNQNQLQSIADEIGKYLTKAGLPIPHMEGYSEANWILMDFGDIIIHLFDKENREFYQLERIWGDATVLEN